VTLWGGAHFEGVRECMNENCVNKGKKIPVGELKFWINRWANNSWFFFCSEECETEVYNIWYAKAHQKQEIAYEKTEGYKVRQLRLSLGESQGQFAKRFNVPHNQVSYWET